MAIESQSLPKRRQFVLFLLFLLFLDFWWILGTKISDVLLDELVKDLGGDPEETATRIQSYDALFNFTVAITVIIFGIVVDKFPERRKPLLILMNLVWIATNILFFILPLSFSLYAGIQILWGITMGANGPLIFSYLGDLFEINFRGRMFSIFAMGLYFIKGGSGIITGFVAEAVGDWKLALVLLAIGGLISLLLFIFLAPEPKIAQIEPEFQDILSATNPYRYRLNPKDFKQILQQKTNFLFILQGFFGMIGVVIVNRYLFYWFTSELRDGMGMNLLPTILLFGAAGGVGAVIGINLAGQFADYQFKQGRLDKMLYFSISAIFIQVGVYALLIYGPAYPASVDGDILNIFQILDDYPAFYQFGVIFGICLMLGTAIGPVVGTTRTHLNFPEHRGTAAALYDTGDFIGAGVGLILGGVFSEALGSFRLTIFFGALFWIISGLVWIMITRYIQEDYRRIRDEMAQRAKAQ